MSYERLDEGASGVFSGTLRDDNLTPGNNNLGDPIPLADLVSLKLTLVNAATGAIINSRDQQNVLNANNVVVNATTGALIWSIHAEDTLMVDNSQSYEEHVATLDWVYQTNKVGKHVHRIGIRNYVQLCTVEDVQMYYQVVNAADVPFIEMLIDQISVRAENDCMRGFKKSTSLSPTTQYFSPKEGQYHLRLYRYPIDSIISLDEDLLSDFSGTGAYHYGTQDFGLVAQNGLVKLRYRPFLEGEQSVRVVYTGGLALDVGSVPMDLRFAATRQVAYWLQRRTQLGVGTVTIARMGKEVLVPVSQDLLVDVQNTFTNYRAIFA